MVAYGMTLMMRPYRDRVVYLMDVLMTVVDLFTLTVPVLYEYHHDRMVKLTNTMTYALIGGQILTIVLHMVYAAVLMRNHMRRLAKSSLMNWMRSQRSKQSTQALKMDDSSNNSDGGSGCFEMAEQSSPLPDDDVNKPASDTEPLTMSRADSDKSTASIRTYRKAHPSIRSMTGNWEDDPMLVSVHDDSEDEVPEHLRDVQRPPTPEHMVAGSAVHPEINNPMATSYLHPSPYELGLGLANDTDDSEEEREVLAALFESPYVLRRERSTKYA
jgi:hypothetical protein